MTDFFDDPAFVHDLLDFVVEMELQFAKAQIEAGADIIGVGDAAASLVGPRIYEEFIWPHEKKMIDALHAMGTRVRLHICGNTRRILGGMGRLGSDMIDIDFMVPMAQARAEHGAAAGAAGNLDPVKAIRHGTPDVDYGGPGSVPSPGRTAIHRGGRLRNRRDTAEANVRAMGEFARDMVDDRASLLGFCLPTQIQFGRGMLRKLGELATPLGSSALLVGYRDRAGLDEAYQRTAESLAKAGIRVATFFEVAPEPDTSTVIQGAEAARQCGRRS